MMVTVERVMILVVVGVFILTSIGELREVPVPITREQAIGISEKSELVREGLATSRGFIIEADYYNASRLQYIKTVGHESWYYRVPEGHTAWEIIWSFSKGVGGHNAIVIIDAERALIIAEPAGIGWE